MWKVCYIVPISIFLFLYMWYVSSGFGIPRPVNLDSRTNAIISYSTTGISSITHQPTSTWIPHTLERKNREQLYAQRRNTVMQGCAKLNRTVTNSLGVTTNYIDAVHNIHYCPIPKVGSTFWKRTLTVLTSKGRLKSPFEITLSGVKRHPLKRLSKEKRLYLEKYGDSILFVRDPYAKIYSGYENKIYQPNPIFWKMVGSKVVKAVRQNKVTYGYDVTFPEFIKYLIHTREDGTQLNGHFKPMHTWCNPCRTHYKYIGQLETFTDDAEYLLSKWRTKFVDVTLRFDDLYKEAALDTLRGHLRYLFGTKSILHNIKYPFINLMLRTWRDLQIRGYMSKKIAFPYNGDASDVTLNEFRTKIAEALEMPQNRSAVKLQRTEALIQAYREVPLNDMEKLRQFVLTDCELFGYDDRPSQLFDRMTHATNDEFLYLDGLSHEPYKTVD